MKWRKLAPALAALTLIILSTFVTQSTLVRGQSGQGTVVSTELINFYSMSTSEVDTFVRTLQTQGIPLFIVRLNAFSEWQSGSSSGVTKAKQVIQAANSRGIEVAVDLHTWYTTWDNSFRDSASRSSTNRANYIRYVKNVVQAFAGTNVYAFMVMNEPQARRASTSENQFILDVIAAAKTVTTKPVSIRFMAGYSPTTGHYSAAIDQASDFLCRNTYWDARSPGRTVYGASEQILLAARDSAHALGKRFWITEFGKSKNNLEEQRSYVEAFVTWARSKGLDGIFCWVSQPDVSGETYNLFSGYTPHPAFYELISDPLPDGLPPPSPPPDEPPPPPDEPPPEDGPHILFEDNFESETLDLWTGTGQTPGETITVTDDEAHHGANSVRCTKTGTSSNRENAYLYKRIGETEEAYANGYFRIDGSTGSRILRDEGDEVDFIRFSDGTQPMATAGIRREAGMTKWRLYSGGKYVTVPIAVSTDCWYSIELHWDAAEGMAEMFVNGAKILQITVGSSYKINAEWVDIGIIAAMRVQNELTVDCDCFRLATTYIGPETGPTFPPWDANQDGIVDLYDTFFVAASYWSTPQSPNWNPQADVNSDGIVDLADLVLVGTHYGEQY